MTMTARSLALLLVASLNAPAAAEFTLIYPEEATAYAAAEETPPDELLESRSFDPLDPQIIIEKPEASASYPSPIDIVIRFDCHDDAEIDLDSLKILYKKGIFKKDVTERVVKGATVTSAGIDARGAELPTGNHSLTVSIADTRGRVGERRFKFRIVKRPKPAPKS